MFKYLGLGAYLGIVFVEVINEASIVAETGLIAT
jgi:hypothetical protein